MATAKKNQFLLRDISPLTKQQLQSQAASLNMSLNKYVNTLLEKEVKHYVFQTELDELVQMKESIQLLTEAVQEYTALTNDLLVLMRR